MIYKLVIWVILLILSFLAGMIADRWLVNEDLKKDSPSTKED